MNVLAMREALPEQSGMVTSAELDVFTALMAVLAKHGDRGLRALAMGEANLVYVTKREKTDPYVINVHRGTLPKEALPERFEEFLDSGLQRAGPVEYDLADVELWRHPEQEGVGEASGRSILEELRQTGLLSRCGTYYDALKLKAQGVELFRTQFPSMIVFFWGSIWKQSDGALMVPALMERTGEAGPVFEIGSRPLTGTWKSGGPAFIRPKA